MRKACLKICGAIYTVYPNALPHAFGGKRIEVSNMDVQKGGRIEPSIQFRLLKRTYIQALWSLQDRNMYCTTEVTQTKKRESEPANEEFTLKVKITESYAEEL